MIWGCGRTDAMVHASQFFLHFDFDGDLPDNLCKTLNLMLPQDIVAYNILPMHDSANAQFDAIERTYDYFFHIFRDPYLSNISSYYDFPDLNIEVMNEACAILTKHTDFRSFCKTPNKHNHTICNVFSAQITTDGNGRYRFTIKANRFLRGMIRIIMANLLDVGNGKLSVDNFEQVIIDKTPPRFLNMAYPQGLFLSQVKYPYLDDQVRYNSVLKIS